MYIHTIASITPVRIVFWSGESLRLCAIRLSKRKNHTHCKKEKEKVSVVLSPKSTAIVDEGTDKTREVTRACIYMGIHLVSTLHTHTPTGSLTTNSDCLTRSGSLKTQSAGSAQTNPTSSQMLRPNPIQKKRKISDQSANSSFHSSPKRKVCIPLWKVSPLHSIACQH